MNCIPHKLYFKTLNFYGVKSVPPNRHYAPEAQAAMLELLITLWGITSELNCALKCMRRRTAQKINIID